MTTTATRPAWPSPSIPSPSSIPASATSQTNSYASSIDTSPPSSIHAPAPPLPPPSEQDDLDQKMADFRRYMASKATGAGPDLILNVAEYATFLPRPFGFKDRSYDRSPSMGPNNINNKCNDWVVPPSPPRTISGYAAGFGPLLGPARKSNDHQAYLCSPASPLEMLRESIEMITKLPAMISPTIPAWAMPPRPVTGGKQPGKVPAVPPDLGASSDDSSSDSDRESDIHTSAAESESVVMSETDTNLRYKTIGRKTARRRNSKVGSLGGKRLSGSISEKVDDPMGSSMECCCLLSSEQVKRLPHRAGTAALSKSPVIVKISIPSFLLPDLASRLELLKSTKTSRLAADEGSQSPTDSPSKSRAKSASKKYFTDDERVYKREKHGVKTLSKHRRTHSSDVGSGSNSGSDRSDVQPKRAKRPFSPVVDRDKHKGGRSTGVSKDSGSRPKGLSKEANEGKAKKATAIELELSIRRRRADSGSPLPLSPSSKRQKKEPKDDNRDDSTRNRKTSKDSESRRPGKDRQRGERDRSSKRRSREYTRSRSQSRSRSPSKNYDRGNGQGRRSSSPSKGKRKQDSSRGLDRPTKDRRDRSHSKSTEGGNSRERGRDRKRRHSRSRSRDRLDRRRDKDKRSHDKSSAALESSIKSTDDLQLQGTKYPMDHRKSESHRGNPSSVSQKSVEPTKSDAASLLDSSADARSRWNTAKMSSLDGLENVSMTSGSIKKILSEDHSQKRLESNVFTPKATTEPPTPITGNSLVLGKTNYQPEEGMRRMSMVTAEPISGGHTKYYREYRRYHALAVSLKRKADEITRIQHNPWLGAMVYFLSGNAFLRAFHLNDKHFEILHSSRPDLVQKESMKCWGSMKQFSTALSVQCHGKFQGLDGLSYLLEALVYYKCHTYSNHRLRQEMQAIEPFRKRASSEALGAAPVMITTELASRLLQNAEDWANLSTKLVNCEAALTPDIARKQFPETFKKWCIHPDDIGKSSLKGFSAVVEQKQTVIVGMLDGVPVQEEKVRTFPKILWPLGTYMSLSNLMDFAEEALNEYQARNGLEYDVSTLP